MAARDRVKTMASRTCSALNGHPEVKKRRDTQALPASGKHKACKPHPSWPTSRTRLLLYHVRKNFLVKCVKSCIFLNIQWPQITVFLRRMESSNFTSILA